MCHAAIFLDYENLYLSLKGKYKDHDILFMNIVDAAVSKIEKDHDSTAVIRKVYAPFDGNYSGLADELALNGFQAVHVLTDVHKNSADLMLAVDAVETVYTRPKIELFCIIGGDRDFIPVVAKLKELGKKCIICSIPGSTSGDLLRFIKDENFVDPMKLVEAVPLYKKPLKPVPAKKDEKAKKPDPKPKAVDDEEFESWKIMLETAHYMATKYDNPDVWVSPFLREVSEKLSHLARRDIRDMMQAMENRGIWEIVQKESNREGIESYSILRMNWNHSLVRETAPGTDEELKV